MDKPYREIAQLVGRVLAKRWLDRNKDNTKPPNTRSPESANGRAVTKPKGKAIADNVTQ